MLKCLTSVMECCSEEGEVGGAASLSVAQHGNGGFRRHWQILLEPAGGFEPATC